MASAVKPMTRARGTTSFTWYGDSNGAMGTPLSQWLDLGSSNGSSTDDVSDVSRTNDQKVKFRGGPTERASYESDMSDERRRFRSNSVKVSYDSDSCLTPRSRRTLRRTLSSAAEPCPGDRTPSKPTLDTIFSPTHEILHPLQSLRLERSFSNTWSIAGSNAELSGRSGRITRTSTVTFESFTLPKPQSNSSELNSHINPSPKPKLKLDSLYTKPALKSEAKLEQKQLSLIRSNSETLHIPPLSAEEKKPETAPDIVVIILDAEKKLTFVALDWAINAAVRPGDEIIILGVLKHILSPMGYKMVADTDPLYGVNRDVLQLEVTRTTETFQSKLSDRIKECEKKKVKLTVRIAPGARVRTVVVRELRALGATYAIFDRKAMRNRRYYTKHLSCHAVRMRKNGHSTKTITLMPQKSAKSQPSDISSVSSTSRTTLWRRITSFRSSCRSRTTSPRSATGSH